MRNELAALIAFSLLSSGCADDGGIASSLFSPSSEQVAFETVPQAKWWEAWNDPVLNKLEEAAISGNRDLRIAQARILEARANRLSATSKLLPDISGQGKASRSDQGLLSQNKAIDLYEASFDASWELDIFGANRKAADAARALVKGAEADHRAVLLSLSAEVARNYVEARSAQQLLAITERNIKSQRSTLEITQSRARAGLVSELDVAQARSLYLDTTARLPALKTAYSSAVNRLNTLTGNLPDAVDPLLAEAKKLPLPKRAMMLATPAQVIEQRPDVQSALATLSAATSLHESAYARLFPNISISGLFGIQNASTLPASAIWSAASGITMPILNFGRLRAGIDAADAREAQALAAYEQAVLQALEDVESSLSAYLNEDARRIVLAKTVESNRSTVALADERYKKGISAFIDVLSAQKTLFESESALAESEASVSRRAIALYKALGGGLTAEASSLSQAQPEAPANAAKAPPPQDPKLKPKPGNAKKRHAPAKKAGPRRQAR